MTTWGSDFQMYQTKHCHLHIGWSQILNLLCCESSGSYSKMVLINHLLVVHYVPSDGGKVMKRTGFWNKMSTLVRDRQPCTRKRLQSECWGNMTLNTLNFNSHHSLFMYCLSKNTFGGEKKILEGSPWNHKWIFIYKRLRTLLFYTTSLLFLTLRGHCLWPSSASRRRCCSSPPQGVKPCAPRTDPASSGRWTGWTELCWPPAGSGAEDPAWRLHSAKKTMGRRKQSFIQKKVILDHFIYRMNWIYWLSLMRLH